LRKQILVVAAFVLLLRLAFLSQAIQGDDVYYLAGAEHAQVDPLHPNHARYPFLGQIVDMRGHPHPPLNAWLLAALLAWLGRVEEAPFHAAYAVFSLLAALSALSIARRLTPRPLEAALLFVATPAFVVNGGSLEADLPFLAFWLASLACFIEAVETRSRKWLLASLAPMALAALAAYQSVVLTPILWLYLCARRRGGKPAWLAALTPPAVLALWQLWERSSTGGMPAAVLAGYLQTYGLEALAQKLKNAGALTAHLGWVVFPPLAGAAFRSKTAWALLPLVAAAAFYDPNPLFWASAGIGALVLLGCARNGRDFAAQWVLVFFAAALVVFFAGSARYLLPLVLPVAILASRQLASRWLYAGAACGFAVSLALAIVNYQHWDGCRRFAQTLAPLARNGRVWINGEWGLRFYLEREGALPLLRGQALEPGDVVVTSALGYPVPFTTGGGMLAPVSETVLTSPIPLRLIALDTRSAYSTAAAGLRPFDISRGPIDRLRAETVIARKPELSYLPMNAPSADQQIVTGVYSLESNAWRWMAGKAILLLKPPPVPTPVEVTLLIPAASPTRTITLLLDGREIAQANYSAPGTYTLTSPPLKPAGSSTALTILAGKTFSAPGDSRVLSVILTAAGFRSK
jgi:4-amino-4-deoxy-L-arabinose transferase-like glycosyltransferase